MQYIIKFSPYKNTLPDSILFIKNNIPLRRVLFLLMKIFFFCCKSAANMSFSLIQIKNHPRLRCQCRINMYKAVSYILMNSAFAYAKSFCRLPHRGVVINNKSGNLNRSFLDIIFQENPPKCICTYYAFRSKYSTYTGKRHSLPTSLKIISISTISL